MAASSRGLRLGIQIILALVIVGLAYFLYVSVTEPYKIIERQQEVTRLTRERMNKVRQVAIHYETRNDRYPLTLDSLAMYARQDSAFLVVRDSILGSGFPVDSLIYSPRTGKMFEYAVNDTARVKMYLLEDPDSDDRIGSLLPDVTQLNAASWE